MNKNILSWAIIHTLTIASTSAIATGFVNLSPSGYTVPGGKSAYTLCNTTGNFGDGVSIRPTFSPGGGKNNTCAINRVNPPLAGYIPVASADRLVTHNGVNIATVNDRVWRNANSCIYGTRVRLRAVQYSPGQTFEVNDVVRAGFRNRGPVSIAYFYSAGADEVLYRAGLTFTSRVTPPNPARPLTSSAPLSSNWVDFTTDLNSDDDDGSTKPDSPWLLVKSTCTSATPTALTGAIQIRQMGQEGQPVLIKRIPGFVPAGANTRP